MTMTDKTPTPDYVDRMNAHDKAHPFDYCQAHKLILVECENELAALRAQAAKAGEPVAWQSMDTAPKDGTAILIMSSQWATVGSWNGAVWKVSAPHYPQYPSDEQPEKWKPIPYEDAAPPSDAPDLLPGLEAVAKPKIICLCGSTRFIHQFAVLQWELEKDGYITLGLHLLPDNYPGVTADHMAETEGVKEQMDELHKRKIDLCDQVLVLNIGGYIGESTRSEIDYAIAHGKPVRYIESTRAEIARLKASAASEPSVEPEKG